MTAARNFHPFVVAAAAMALVEPAEGEVVETFSPQTIEGEPHCRTCGSIMRCVDNASHGTDRVELRWVCPNGDSEPVITIESVWREPEFGHWPPRIVGAEQLQLEDDDSMPGDR